MRRKRIPTALLALIVALCFFVPGMAAIDSSVKVQDQAGLFTESEQKLLEEKINSIHMQFPLLDVVVVTTNDAQGKTGQAYADDFFDYNGFGYGPDDDGILLLLDMDNREIAISTHKLGQRAFSDRAINSLLDAVYDYMVESDYYGAADVFLDLTRSEMAAYYQREGVTGTGPDYGRALQIALLIALVATGVVMGILVAMHKASLAAAPNVAQAYLQGGVKLTHRQDRFLYTRTTKTAIPQNNSGSGGGGGGSGHSSSSGRTHGGGSRKF